MSLTTTTRGPGDPRRRRVLAGGAAALLAGGGAVLTGCSADPDPGERSSAEERLRARAGRGSAALLERYDATIGAHAGLGERLRPLRAEVARHAAALGARPSSASPSASGSASPSGPSASAPAGTSGPAVPKDEKAALAALADAERRTADTHTAALASAPPELARLLASVAASGAAHAYLLGGVA
ncbi:hypothetical protein [Streptomyces syringium]|uniref:hypothetical protein n=1 Tax=Streptomyces syringium TaxID=76729 RepID=UPI0033C95768